MWQRSIPARQIRLRLADLFRFQRLHGYGARRGQGHGFRSHAEFQQSLFIDRLGRILVPLAYQLIKLVSRLRLHSPWRKPAWLTDYLSELIYHLPDFGNLARRCLDVCNLGRPACRRHFGDTRTRAVSLLSRARATLLEANRNLCLCLFRLDFFPRRLHWRCHADYFADRFWLLAHTADARAHVAARRGSLGLPISLRVPP